jgi:hypothetical protein
LAEEVLSYPSKLFCRNICYPLWISYSSSSIQGLLLKTLPFKETKKKITTRIKVRWTCWPNTTGDNSAPNYMEHRYVHAVWAVGESWPNLSWSLSSSDISGNKCPRMTCTYFASATMLHQKEECQLRIDLAFKCRLQKPNAKMNPASWILWLQDMDCCSHFSS